jgi:hypothetical protein
MKNIAINTFLFIILAISLNACKTDLDIIAEGQEIAVVYGLLNINETEHKIRINKSFIGNEDANDLAQVQSNLEFGDILTVTVQEVVNNATTNTFTLNRVLNTSKQPGVFAYPNQYIYTFNATLNPNAIYKLKIVNNENSKEYTAETPIVNDFLVSNPTSTPQSTIVFGNQVTGISNFNVRWTSPINGIRTDIKIVFKYLEYNTVTGDTTWAEIVTDLDDNTSRNDQGGELMQRLFNGIAFAERLKNELGPPASLDIERWIHSLDFYFSVAAEEFNTFMVVNQNTAPSFQETPAYTNISDGRGIFSSRFNQNILNKGINQSTAKQLKENDITQSVRFTRFYNPLNGQYQIIN